MCALFPACIASPAVNTCWYTFVVIDEPTLIDHYHPDCTGDIRAHSWCEYSLGLDKCGMACSPVAAPCRVIPLPRAALCSSDSSLALVPDDHRSFYCSHSFVFQECL